MGFAHSKETKYLIDLIDLFKKITLIQNRKLTRLADENALLQQKLITRQRELDDARSKLKAGKRRRTK